MRWSAFVLVAAVVAIVCLAAGTALAKPKVAVAPFKGDKGNKVADALVDALGDRAKVTATGPTSKALAKVDVEGEPDISEANRVQSKLGVDALVTGKLQRDGGTQTLKVVVFVRGKSPSRFTVQFKTISKQFKDDVSRQIVKKIDDDDDDGKRRLSDKKKDDDDKKRKKKDVADTDDPDNPDNEPKKVKKKKRRRGGDDDDTPRRVAARLDAGGFGGVRKLTYNATTPPPPVGTRTLAARVEGELYPFALGDNQKGGAAGFGFGFEYEKTLGTTINTGNRNFPIDQGHYAIGARYRINAGATTMVVLGVDYAGRHYIADRSEGALDMPDTNYKAVAPHACVMKLVKPTVGVFGRIGGELILDTGRIQDNDQYGAATVYGLDLDVGTDIGLSERLALRLAADINQISLKFKGTGAESMARGVSAATDRQFGVTATLGFTY